MTRNAFLVIIEAEAEKYLSFSFAMGDRVSTQTAACAAVECSHRYADPTGPLPIALCRPDDMAAAILHAVTVQ